MWYTEDNQRLQAASALTDLKMFMAVDFFHVQKLESETDGQASRFPRRKSNYPTYLIDKMHKLKFLFTFLLQWFILNTKSGSYHVVDAIRATFPQHIKLTGQRQKTIKGLYSAGLFRPEDFLLFWYSVSQSGRRQSVTRLS